MHDDTTTPTCERANDQRIGAWKALKVLEDNVVLQCGFANRKHMAPFVKVDVQGTPRKFVQVNKGARWFVAAVGGPQLKKGDMPTVTVLEELVDKLAENIKTTMRHALLLTRSQRPQLRPLGKVRREIGWLTQCWN